MEEAGFLTIDQIRRREAVKKMSIKELAEFFDISEWSAERFFRTKNPDKGRLGVNSKTIRKIRKRANNLPFHKKKDET